MRPADRPLAALTILRVTLGLVLATHGFSKLFLGFLEPLGGFLGSLGLPVPMAFAWVIALLELGGGILFASGVVFRPLIAYYLLQLGIGIFTVHGRNGWYTVGPGLNGIEYSVTLMAGLVALWTGGRGHRLPLPRRR
jgi:putative oxidoreductase